MSVKVYEIHVRSKDCRQLSAGLNTNFEVTLKAPITKPPGHSFLLTLASAKIPFAWYSISEHLTSNKLEVIGSGRDLTLPDGNYDIWEIESLINADLTFGFSCVYNQNTSKVTLTNTGADCILSLSSAASSGLAKALGFTAVDRVIVTGSSVTSDGIVNLHVVHSIFVYSSLAVTNVITTADNNYEKILDKITTSEVAPFDMIVHAPNQKGAFHAEVQQDVIGSFTLALKDQNAKLLDLNGVNFELSVSVEIVPSVFHERQDARVPLSMFRQQIREEESRKRPRRVEEPQYSDFQNAMLMAQMLD